MKLTHTSAPQLIAEDTPLTLPGVRLLHLLQDAAGWCVDRPWLAAVAFVAIVAATMTRAMVLTARHRRLSRHAHQVLITPPPEVDPAGVKAWWANIAELLAPSPWRRRWYGTPHIAVEYRWAGRQLTIVVWVPGPVAAGPIAAAARSAWPGASCVIGDATAPMPAHSPAQGGALIPALAPWYVLETEHDTDPMRALVAAGSGLHATERACVQVLARPATPRQVTRLRRGAASLRTGRPNNSPLDPTTWC